MIPSSIGKKDRSASAYAWHKQQMALKSDISSRAFRDIAPLPCIGSPKDRIDCRYNLNQFLLTYLPSKFPIPFGSNHDEFISRLQDIILHGGRQAIAMPRSSGKTTINKGAALWAITYGHRKFVFIVSATKEESLSFIEDMKSTITSSKYLNDFPEIGYPLLKMEGNPLLSRGQLFYNKTTNIVSGANKLQLPLIASSLASKSVFMTTGITAAMRGKSATGDNASTIRPDFIIIDDPQKDEDALNPARIEKIESKINKTIEGLVEDGNNAALTLNVTCILPNDLASRYLSHDLYPQWHGLRFSMVPKMPKNIGLWLNDYGDIRKKDPKAATEYYKLHRKEMDEGAIVDWPERFDKKNEISRLQRAMNYYIDNEASFWSERQNKPLDVRSEGVIALSSDIIRKVNGIKRYTLTQGHNTIIGFIDIHSNILYYVLCSFDDLRNCHVIDYGTFPNQKSNYFYKNSSGNITLKNIYPNSDIDGRIEEGLLALISSITSIQYKNQDEVIIPISRIYIDTGFKRDQVESAIARSGSAILRPSKGRGIKSSQKPMAEYMRKPGERIGNHWIEQSTKGRNYKTTFIDTNYWKTEAHYSLSLGVGDRTSISLWGNDPSKHRLFADQMNAETCLLVKTGEHELYEWQAIPGQDNHYFDCLVGCLAGASVMGVNK